MLHRSTVESNTLELLELLMSQQILRDFVLVGGTALALQLGHRRSIDLDLFGSGDIHVVDHHLMNSSIYPNINVISRSPSILIFQINGIKVDFVNYPFAWLRPWITREDIRMAAKEDIAAMKIEAITGRGSRKDFVDLFFLLDFFSLDEIMAFHKEKFPRSSQFLALKSLVYFNDAEQQDMPIMYSSTAWDDIKETIIEKHAKLV